MALIVETGVGLANADSFASEAFAVQFLADHGYRPWANVEQRLRRGTRYIELVFSGRWPGQRTHGRAQALSWPRKNVLDDDGNLIEDDTIPAELIAATIEAGRLVGVDGVLPTPAQVQKKVQVGSISVEYADGDPPSEVIPLIESWLRPILVTRSTSGFLGRA